MTPDYSIVSARPDDVPHIRTIELAAAELLRGHAPDAVLNEATSEPRVRQAQEEGRLWVALAAGTPVGFAHIELLEPQAVHLEELDVLPAHGRRGLGRRLVQHVCRWAATHGYPAVTLTTFRDVPWNMPFYTTLGFEVIPPTALTPALQAALHEEASRGLDPARRVAMRWRALPDLPTP